MIEPPDDDGPGWAARARDDSRWIGAAVAAARDGEFARAVFLVERLVEVDGLDPLDREAARRLRGALLSAVGCLADVLARLDEADPGAGQQLLDHWLGISDYPKELLDGPAERD